MGLHSPGGQLLLRWSPWVLGTILALALWPHLRLPFHPAIPTPLTENPGDNTLRFGVTLAAPLLLLVLASLAQVFRHSWEGIVGSPSPKPSAFPWPLAVLALLLSLALPTYHASGPFDAYHEGESLGSALSWEAGLKPYRDFIVGHGVFEDPLRSVAAFHIFGRSIGAERTFQSCVKVVAWLALTWAVWFLLGRRTWPTAGAICLLAALYPGGLFRLFLAPWSADVPWSGSFLRFQPVLSPLEWVVVTPRSWLLYTFLALLGAWSFTACRGRTRKLLSFFLGFLPPFAFGYSLDMGFYVGALALLTMTWVTLAVEASDRKAFWGWLLLGIGVGAATLHLLLRGSWEGFFHYTFQVVPAAKGWTDGIPYPVFQAPFLLALLLVSSNVYRMALGFLQARDLPGRFFARAWDLLGLEAAFTLAGVFFFRSALDRADWEHVIYGLAPSLLAAYAALLRSWEGCPCASPEGLRKIGRAAVLLFGLMACARLFVGGGWTRNFPVHVPDAMILSASQVRTLEALKGLLGPDDGFYAFSSQPAWYYLLGRRCPTRFPGSWFAWTEEYQLSTVRDLQEKKPRWVLYDSVDWSSRVDGRSSAERLPIVDAYIKTNYRPYLLVEGNAIWIRNE